MYNVTDAIKVLLCFVNKVVFELRIVLQKCRAHYCGGKFMGEKALSEGGPGDGGNINANLLGIALLQPIELLTSTDCVACMMIVGPFQLTRAIGGRNTG